MVVEERLVLARLPGTLRSQSKRRQLQAGDVHSHIEEVASDVRNAAMRPALGRLDSHDMARDESEHVTARGAVRELLPRTQSAQPEMDRADFGNAGFDHVRTGRLYLRTHGLRAFDTGPSLKCGERDGGGRPARDREIQDRRRELPLALESLDRDAPSGIPAVLHRHDLDSPATE